MCVGVQCGKTCCFMIRNLQRRSFFIKRCPKIEVFHANFGTSSFKRCVYELSDVVWTNLLCMMYDGGVSTTALGPCSSLVTFVPLQFPRVCIVPDTRGACLSLSCGTVSTTADLATKCLPLMGNIATQSWSMTDEWPSEVTLTSERMSTEVSTVQRCFFAFLGSFSLHEFS